MLKSAIHSFMQEEEGQDLVEYTLLLAFIALAAVANLQTLQKSIAALMGKVGAKLDAANP